MYIGSTSKTLKTRLSKHKQDYKTWLVDNLKYVSSFEILKFNDHVIELIETCVYIDKLERNEKEGYYIKLNKLICVTRWRVVGILSTDMLGESSFGHFDFFSPTLDYALYRAFIFNS